MPKGGKRAGAGRKARDGQPGTPTSIWLHPDERATLATLGEGNVSEGARRLIAAHEAARPPSWERMDYPVPALSEARLRILTLLAAGHSARRPDRAHGWQVAGQSIQSGTLSQMRNIGWLVSPDGGRTYVITDAGRAVLANAGEPAEGNK